MKKNLIWLLFVSYALAAYDFSVFKKGDENGTTILVVGGIQGDEPGGFNAAALLATRYKISHGALWVVPNLNFDSIIARSRGLSGDMNRKFLHIKPSDPDYKNVERIKDLILNDSVDFVINLHDGSGFYREKYIDASQNPDKWGQCSIIDQKEIKDVRFGNLEEISHFVVEHVNRHSIAEKFNYRTNNTKTGEGNEEMAKTLTWFAVRHNKPAFGNEASKNFLTRTRVFYHLLAVEAFMNYAGIEYERDFELSPAGVERALDKDIGVNINQKIAFKVTDIRPRNAFFPLKKGTAQEINATNPLVTLVKNPGFYRVHYGNRRYGILVPEYFSYDENLSEYELSIDGQDKNVSFGSTVNVAQSFMAKEKDGYRVNVIGYARAGLANETDVNITKQSLAQKFSLDKKGNVYRVEVYNTQNNAFAGMILVDFSKANTRGGKKE